MYFGTTPRLHKSKEAYPICVMCVVVHERKVVTKKKAPVSLFLTEIISKMPTGKLYNRFHVGKNGIRVGNFQKILFF